MLKNKTVAVVVPAYFEENQICRVIETMPDFVDRIVVVDDGSTDKTAEVVKGYIDENNSNPTPILEKKPVVPNHYNKAEQVLEKISEGESKYYTPSLVYTKEASRITLIVHKKNAGVGSSIATGYKWCKDHKIYCTALMGGDGQMDPAELESICMPVIDDEVDYVKANRLKHRSALFVIPKLRFFGNSILSLLTKIASGYWHVSDSQTGYTAISLKALNAIRIHQIYPRYGCPNDILVSLNISFCTIKEVESKPVYKIGERSKMNELKVVPKISWMLFRLFWKRLYVKYLFRDFHPLFLLYHFALFLLIINIPIGIKILQMVSAGENVTFQSLLVFVLLSVSGFQSLFFAMWMDMMDNERLQK